MSAEDPTEELNELLELIRQRKLLPNAKRWAENAKRRYWAAIG